MRPVGKIAAVLAACCLAACGSTLPASEQNAARQSSATDSGLNAGLNANDTGGTTATTEGGSATTGNASPGTTSPDLSANATASTELGGSGPPGIVSAVTSGVANGPGVSAKSINIGFVYETNSQQAQAAIGNTTVTTGDEHADAVAVFNDINKHGGAGRQLGPVWDAVDATSSATTAQVVQAACAKFTQDNHVLAVEGSSLVQFRDCMAKAGSVTAAGSVASMTDNDYRTSPLYYDVQALSVDRLGRNLVDELLRDGYFTPWDNLNGRPGSLPVKVGIVYPDEPQWVEAVNKVIVPDLEAHHINVARGDIQEWHFPDSTSAEAGSIAQIAGAVIRLKADLVTHVLPIDVNSLGFFALPADSQHYRPRYGVSSAVQAQQFAGSLVPYEQLNGAIGLGWTPAEDLPASMLTGAYNGPGRAHCLQVMQAAGITASSQNALTVELLVCDVLYSIQDALNEIPTGTAITGASFMQGLVNAGSVFKIAGLPAGGFTATQHYPVNSGYRYEYYPSCKCFHYDGGLFTLEP
jgi:hypothetical protein